MRPRELLGRSGWGRLCGREHSCERLEQLPVGGAAVRRLGEHNGEAPPEQRIAHRVGGELQGEGDEPWCLARSCARPGHGGVLLEYGEEKRALRRKLPVDRTLGEAGRLSDVVEGGELDAALREDAQSRLEEQSFSLGGSPLPDTHRNLRYPLESSQAS